MSSNKISILPVCVKRKKPQVKLNNSYYVDRLVTFHNKYHNTQVLKVKNGLWLVLHIKLKNDKSQVTVQGRRFDLSCRAGLFVQE